MVVGLDHIRHVFICLIHVCALLGQKSVNYVNDELLMDPTCGCVA